MALYAVDAVTADALERDLRAFVAEDAGQIVALTFARQLTRPCVARP